MTTGNNNPLRHALARPALRRIAGAHTFARGEEYFARERGRSPRLPEVPTVAESGYPGFVASLWLAVFAPAGTPAPVLERLQQEIRAVVQAPDSADAIDKAGAEPVSSSSAELAAIVRDGIAKYAKVVKMADVKPE